MKLLFFRPSVVRSSLCESAIQMHISPIHIIIRWPVMCDARSEIRNRTASAISSALVILFPSGILENNRRLFFRRIRKRVQPLPVKRRHHFRGHTHRTRTPAGARSAAHSRASASIAPFRRGIARRSSLPGHCDLGSDIQNVSAGFFQRRKRVMCEVKIAK